MHACAFNQPRPQAPAQRPPSNGLGVAGFVVSLVGVVATCGALAPVGLLLSLVAMFKKPRGFAFAGVVLGLIGTVQISVITLSGVAAAGFAAEQARMHEQLGQREQAQIQIAGLAERVGVFHEQNARPPLALDLLPFVDASMLIDPWGRAFEFEPELDGFTIRSVGPDGIGFTDDDVVQTWSYSSDGIAPRELMTEPEIGSMDTVLPSPPIPPVPPAAPDAPPAPSISFAL